MSYLSCNITNNQKCVIFCTIRAEIQITSSNKHQKTINMISVDFLLANDFISLQWTKDEEFPLVKERKREIEREVEREREREGERERECVCMTNKKRERGRER